MQINKVYDIEVLKFFQHTGTFIPRLRVNQSFCEGDIYQVMDTGSEFLVGRGSSYFNTFQGGYPMSNLTQGVDYELVSMNFKMPPNKTQITPKMQPRLKVLVEKFSGCQYFDYNDALKAIQEIEPDIKMGAINAFVRKASGEIETENNCANQKTIIKKERYYKSFLTKHDDITKMPQSYQDDWKRKDEAMKAQGREYTYSPIFYNITEDNLIEFIKYFG